MANSKKTARSSGGAKSSGGARSSGGAKRTAGNTGRVRKKHRGRTILLCLILWVLAALTLVVVIGWNKGVKDCMESFGRPVVRELDLDGLNSESAVLIRASGGKVLGEQNSREIIYPASLTKMMTAILAIEKLSLNDQITLSSDIFAGLYAQDATQAGFQPGETTTVRELLYGALLPSGAECCLALAEEVSGSEEAFVELMNRKAARIGMTSTHFADTTGLHDPEHYSTVYDMAILLKYCLRNKTFREIITSPNHVVPATNMHPEGFTFYSTLFRNLPDPYVTGGRIRGGKTGYTSAAGHCLASFAEIEGREYILVTAGAGGTAEEALHIKDAQTVYQRLGEKASSSP